MDLYIYYRARCENASRLQEKAIVMQQRLSREYGIVTALKRRPQAKDDRHTWMEVYLAVPEEFDAALTLAVAQAGLIDLIDGPRHTEIFLDCSSCV